MLFLLLLSTIAGGAFILADAEFTGGRLFINPVSKLLGFTQKTTPAITAGNAHYIAQLRAVYNDFNSEDPNLNTDEINFLSEYAKTFIQAHPTTIREDKREDILATEGAARVETVNNLFNAYPEIPASLRHADPVLGAISKLDRLNQYAIAYINQRHTGEATSHDNVPAPTVIDEFTTRIHELQKLLNMLPLHLPGLGEELLFNHANFLKELTILQDTYSMFPETSRASIRPEYENTLSTLEPKIATHITRFEEHGNKQARISRNYIEDAFNHDDADVADASNNTGVDVADDTNASAGVQAPEKEATATDMLEAAKASATRLAEAGAVISALAETTEELRAAEYYKELALDYEALTTHIDRPARA